MAGYQYNQSGEEYGAPSAPSYIADPNAARSQTNGFSGAFPTGYAVNGGYPPAAPSVLPLGDGYGASYAQFNPFDPFLATSQPNGAYDANPSTVPYGFPLASKSPAEFPVDADPKVVAAFRSADVYNKGFIDVDELQRALSLLGHNISSRVTRMAMDVYTYSYDTLNKMVPEEFVRLCKEFRIFQDTYWGFDVPFYLRKDLPYLKSFANENLEFPNHSGIMDPMYLQDAIKNLGFTVPPMVLDLMALKFKKIGGKAQPIDYDNFIECCLIIKGLTEKFKVKDIMCRNAATFTYQDFMLTVAPFIE